MIKKLAREEAAWSLVVLGLGVDGHFVAICKYDPFPWKQTMEFPIQESGLILARSGGLGGDFSLVPDSYGDMDEESIAGGGKTC